MRSAPSYGTTPSVAAIVVNLNSGELLGRSLQSLADQTVKPARTIVVDNGSSDGSLEGLEERFPGVEVLRLGENVGFARANNIAVEHVQDCEWVALVNPDAFPEPTWLERLDEAASARPEFGFFASRLIAGSHGTTLDGTGDFYHVSGWAWQRGHGQRVGQVDDDPQGEEEVFAPCAAAALYRRDAFQAVGGFDESYFCYFEDIDLGFRLRLAGHRCLYVPQAVAIHLGATTSGRESDFAVYHAHRNLVWTYLKNMPTGLLLLYLPHHLFVNVLTLGWFSLRGHPRAIFRAKLDALRGLRRVLATRRDVQARRLVEAGDIRRALSRGVSGYVSAWRLAREA
jgi:GT2 family glycosyltransferase